MTSLLPPPTSRVRRVVGAVLRSPVGDLADALVGPHGLDRYLELVDPLFARDVNRAIVVDVRRETHDTTTLTLRPARPVHHRAGQYVELTVEIGGRRHSRCYSISSSEHGMARTADPGTFTITVKADPAGMVSPFLANAIGRGAIVEVSEAMGDFVVPSQRPDRLLLISGGSGITPVMSILRTLTDEGAGTDITFLHYARTEADVAFAQELDLLATFPNVHVTIVHTRPAADHAEVPDEGGLRGHLTRQHLDALAPQLADVPTWVCGPTGLVDAASELFQQAGVSDQLRVERFQLGPLAAADPSTVGGTLTFADSHLDVVATAATILAQAEDAGLRPKAGCRMGICHTCIRPKLAGQVRDVRDGSLSSCGPETVQICVSAPVGDVTIDL